MSSEDRPAARTNRSSGLRGLGLRAVRKALRRIDGLLQGPLPSDHPSGSPKSCEKFQSYVDQLRSLEVDAESKRYVAVHIERLARTLCFVPAAQPGWRLLELGCYMQLTPLLADELGYSEVRGAYFGQLGESHTKSVERQDGVFECRIDLFNAEKDRFPYADGSFDVVLACEILEHLAHDPLHMLLECRRILVDSGSLLLTTPNSVSVTSVARALLGKTSPQVFSHYPDPRKHEACGAHVREYSPAEVATVAEAAGFRVETLTTERVDGFTADTWVFDLLRDNGFDPSLRGEQIFCLARKVEAHPIERYPAELYEWIEGG